MHQERLQSDSSLSPSVTSKLVAATPLIETPGATSRLNTIIHQAETKDTSSSSSAIYNLASIHHPGHGQFDDRITVEPEQVLTTIHYEDSDEKKKHRSTSSSSSDRSSAKSASQMNITSIDVAPAPHRNANLYRSFESLPHSHKEKPGLKPSDKTASLDFGAKPVQYDDAGSIYITPVEAPLPAIQSHSVVKGWLRKQNRDSFFKRIERYYCVLNNDALLMHKHDYDRTPQKAINLKGILTRVFLHRSAHIKRSMFRCQSLVL